jgi:hypothetical protein
MVASSYSTHQPIYQVAFNSTASGRIIASTKRRACWLYGHMNSNKAVLNGNKIGASCRGREHGITLEWSLTSGKKRVFHDSIEVHFSVGHRGDCLQDGKFQCTWTTREHTFSIIAYAYLPLSKTRATRKQFDLLIDGCSFDNLPRIYELGSWSGLSNHSSTTIVNAMLPKNVLNSHRRFLLDTGESNIIEDEERECSNKRVEIL